MPYVVIVVFLVTIDRPPIQATPTQEAMSSYGHGQRHVEQTRQPLQEESLDFPARYGVRIVRGAEIFEIRDEEGVVLNDMTRYYIYTVDVVVVVAVVCLSVRCMYPMKKNKSDANPPNLYDGILISHFL